jgi:hypothetical protein
MHPVTFDARNQVVLMECDRLQIFDVCGIAMNNAGDYN